MNLELTEENEKLVINIANRQKVGFNEALNFIISNWGESSSYSNYLAERLKKNGIKGDLPRSLVPLSTYKVIKELYDKDNFKNYAKVIRSLLLHFYKADKLTLKIIEDHSFLKEKIETEEEMVWIPRTRQPAIYVEAFDEIHRRLNVPKKDVYTILVKSYEKVF